VPRWYPLYSNKLLRTHRCKRAEANRFAGDVLRAEAFAQAVPQATTRRRVTLYLAWPPKERRCDYDAPLKVGLDGLVLSGLLLDDGPRGMPCGALVEFVDGAKDVWGFAVRMEDCK
jgi:hypothetical protein